MAQRLYLKGNYIIVENNGIFAEYSTSKSAFRTTENTYVLIEFLFGNQLIIEFVDIGLWLDAQTGGVAYTDATLKAFFENNTQAR